MKKLLLLFILWPAVVLAQPVRFQWGTTNTGVVLTNIVKSLATNVVTQNGGGGGFTGNPNQFSVSSGFTNIVSGAIVTNLYHSNRFTISSNIVSYGGDARGANATDLQVFRSDPTNVASGIASVLLGGKDNTVSGQASAILSGWTNWVSGSNSVIVGGFNGYVSGSQSYVGVSYSSSAGANFDGAKGLNVSGNQSAIIAGEDCAVNATQSGILVGNDSTVNGRLSFIGGGNNNIINGDNVAGFGHGANSVIVGGGNNIVGVGTAKITHGSNSSTAGPSYATIAGGAFNFANSNANVGTIIGGRNSSVNALAAITIGSYTTNDFPYGVSIGYSNIVRIDLSPDRGIEVPFGRVGFANPPTLTNGIILRSNTFPITSFAELGNSGCVFWNSNGVGYLVCTNSLSGTATTNLANGVIPDPFTVGTLNATTVNGNGSGITNIFASAIVRNTNAMLDIAVINLTNINEFTNITANWTVSGFTAGTYNGTNVQVVHRMYKNTSGSGVKTVTLPASWTDISGIGNPIYITNFLRFDVEVWPTFATNFTATGN